jgi:parallel beta-helix repeat protein
MTLDGNDAFSTTEATSYGRFGIYAEACNYTLFDHVRTIDWHGYGFDPHGTGGTTIASYYLTVTNCEAINNGWDGFTIDKCVNSVVANNKAIGNGRHGINIVTGSKFGDIHDNYIKNNGFNYKNTAVGCGIMVQNNQGYSTSDHNIHNNQIINSYKGGMCLTDVFNIQIDNNEITDTSVCLRVKSIKSISDNNIVITDNVCAGTPFISDTSGYVGPIPTFMSIMNPKTEYIIAPAGSTASADFVCTGQNDENTIMKAITYLGFTGGTITLLEGIFNINNNIFIASNLVIQGQGIDKTVLRLQNTAAPWKIGTKSNAGLIHGYQNSNIVIRKLTLDGNRQNQPNDEAYNYGKYGFYCEVCTNVLLDNIRSTNHCGYGIDPHGTQPTTSYSDGFTIQNSVIDNNGWDGVTIDQTLNVLIYNNVIKNNGRHGVNIVTGSKNVLIDSNIIDNNGYYYYSGALGCGITTQNNGLFGTSDIVVKSNTVTTSATSSVCVRDTENTQFISNNINGAYTCMKFTDSSVIYLDSNVCGSARKIYIYAPYSDVTLVNQLVVYA